MCCWRTGDGPDTRETVLVAVSHLLENRVFIVTGGGQGLGKAFARSIAAHGGTVVVADIAADSAEKVASEIRETGGHALGLCMDIKDPDACDQLVAAADREFGRLDGLVNNAGVIVTGDTASESSVAIRQLVDVNIVGSVLCGNAAIRAMRRYGDGGSIVNLSSGALQGIEGLALYGMTKGAIASLTYGWALDLHKDGIRCNALAPLANTHMSTHVPGPESSRGPEPDRIAPAAVFLLSSLSANLTGQILRFDGKKMGLVIPGHLTTVTEREDWSPQEIAESIATDLADAIAPVGLANSPRPQWV